MKSGISSLAAWSATALLAFCLWGCITTCRFGYPHPSNARSMIMVSLSKSFDDVFRIIIDDEFILQRKLNLNRRGSTSWDMTSGMFAGLPVVLSCTRDYTGDKPVTLCDFSIGAGEHVTVKVY